MYPRYLFTIFNFSLDILFLIAQVSFPSSPNPFSTQLFLVYSDFEAHLICELPVQLMHIAITWFDLLHPHPTHLQLLQLSLHIYSQRWRANRKAADFLAIPSYKLAGRFVGIYASISASFRFTRRSIYCIGQAGLRVGRFTCLASESAGEQTGQNIYK